MGIERDIRGGRKTGPADGGVYRFDPAVRLSNNMMQIIRMGGAVFASVGTSSSTACQRSRAYLDPLHHPTGLPLN